MLFPRATRLHVATAAPSFATRLCLLGMLTATLVAGLFAAAPGSVIAGVNTYGVAQYIQPGYFLLPHSRLPFRIALGTSDIYGDGRSVDGYGLDVDVLLPEELDQTTERITRLAELLSSQSRQ